METNEINNNDNNKSDYRKVLRPDSIHFKENPAYVYSGTKGIINWKLSSITEPEIDGQRSYLNFNDFNYECFEESDRIKDGKTSDEMSRFLSENPSTSSSTAERHNMRKETMGKRGTLAVEPNNNQPSSRSNQQITIQQRGDGGNIIYGWRKQCLYVIIFLLMILISVNLALTLWILKVMEISSNGIGQLKVIDSGVQLEGQAIIMDELRTSHVRSRHGQPITFESSRNITFNTRDADGMLENQMFLGHDKFELQTKKFRVSDTHGNTLFFVDRDLVEIAAGSLRIEGEGGVTFKDSIQTSLLKAEPGKDLKLESPTRSLEMQASQEIFVQSRAGSIEASSLNDIKLRSISGSIRLDAENLIFSNLKTTQPPSYSESPKIDHLAMHKIYQVCVCDNGKLFLASSHSKCYSGDVCRNFNS